MSKLDTKTIADHLVESLGFECSSDDTAYKRTLHKDGIIITIRIDSRAETRSEYNRSYYQVNRARIALQRRMYRRGIKVSVS